jgi:hypothetical protein
VIRKVPGSAPRRRQEREDKMTNAELITALQKLPPEAPALRGDPEWGILHIKDVKMADVIVSADSMREAFDGSGDHLNDDETLVRCVVLR